jgi:hypothetical protein
MTTVAVGQAYVPALILFLPPELHLQKDERGTAVTAVESFVQSGALYFQELLQRFDKFALTFSN